MTIAFTLSVAPWPQPLDPLHSIGLSAIVATIPLIVVLVLMGGLRKSGLVASVCGLGSAAVLAAAVWRMPIALASWSVLYGFAYATWSILWLVLCALWLYNLAVSTGSFDKLRQWVQQHASTDACVQAILVAFCFGALLEGSAGFGSPIAVTAFLLVGLGLEARKAVVIALLANTAPVAFGAVGIPIVALAGVTGMDVMKLSAMVGRQLPLLSLILPMYLALVVAGPRGLRRSWPPALVTGVSFAGVQFLVSNLWGPYATDILSSLVSIVVLVAFLQVWKPGKNGRFSESHSTSAVAEDRLFSGSALSAWAPWVILAVVMVFWSLFKVSALGQIPMRIPVLHDGVYISLYQKPYSAIFTFQPLATGTGVLAATIIVALWFRVRPRSFVEAGGRTLRQLRVPGLTVLFIVGLAYLYNYSGMAYTLGAAVARLGGIFPLVSSYLGWVACFLSGSDTAANLLFGNLQVAAAHQLHLNPLLLAATNSSGAVAGKMISPQNIAVGVTTVGLIGQEGKVLQSTFWHSVLFAGLLGLIAITQAYAIPQMVP
ncbi:MAG: L-lactate permease [Acidobacteriota bacterium]|nr:L-lactate permease [Acidobacteriota bacterium]